MPLVINGLKCPTENTGICRYKMKQLNGSEIKECIKFSDPEKGMHDVLIITELVS